MNNRLNETLSNVAEEVFESLAFVLPAFEDEEESTLPAEDKMTTAAITFAGPFEGSMTVSISSELLPAVAGNMLGLDFDEEPSPEMQGDALKELLNVLCGNLLPKLAGEEVVFSVAAAEVLKDNTAPSDFAGQAATVSTRLHLEGGWAELTLFAPDCLPANAKGAA